MRLLIGGLQTLLLIGVIVALACWLVGPGRAAAAIRRGGGRALDRTAGAVRRGGLELGGFARAVAHNRAAIEIALVVAAAAVLVVWRHPGIAGTVWVAIGLALAVAAVELIGRTAASAVDAE